jgi:hypothetical protein
MRTRGDHQRRIGAAEVVETQTDETAPANGASEGAVAEVVVVEELAAR